MTKRIENGLAQCRIVEYATWCGLERLPNPGAEANHLDEVIEVAGLKRGILPVVGEAQELLVAR